MQTKWFETNVQHMRKSKLNKCAISEKMLKSKTGYVNIGSRGKTHTKNTKREIPGMIC